MKKTAKPVSIWLPPALCLLFLWAAPTIAIGVENVPTSHAEGRAGAIPRLKVWSGAGLNINFVATGEKITKVWLDDPSRLTVDFDAPLDGGGASIVHLRRIQGLDFHRLPATPTTVLTVVTQGQLGEKKLYQFEIAYGSGTPSYSTVNVNPDIRPQLQRQQRRHQRLRQRLERIETGLALAQSHNQSAKNEQVFSRVKTLMAFVRSGLSVEEAARRVNVSMSVIRQLEQFANARGGKDDN